jgi:hypothetical protein
MLLWYIMIHGQQNVKLTQPLLNLSQTWDKWINIQTFMQLQHQFSWRLRSSGMWLCQCLLMPSPSWVKQSKKNGILGVLVSWQWRHYGPFKHDNRIRRNISVHTIRPESLSVSVWTLCDVQVVLHKRNKEWYLLDHIWCKFQYQISTETYSVVPEMKVHT